MSSEFEGSTTVIASDHAERIAGVELAVVEGPDRGRRVKLSDGVARVGTAAGATLKLSDPTVSRLHCEVTVGREGIRLIDTESTNGTFFEGCRVRDIDLRPGALVCLGSTTLRIDLTQEASYVELSSRSGFGELVGSSREMRRIYAVLEKAALVDATVLVSGETGTGKELVAQALHDASARARGPYVTLDCGAIPENLIESELFGHVRGAFSGAISDRKGVIEEADGGSIFLDEIGELPITMQPKLLRALETRSVRRVGSNQPRKVDVRVIAATNRSLARSVNEGSFREDLYYRLAVIEIELPPLRARRDDIPALAAHFIERFTGRAEPPPPELLSTLLMRAWPGNIRELRNFVERSVSLGWPDAAAITPQAAAEPARDVKQLVPVHLSLKEARLSWMAQFESVYVRALLDKTRGNVTRAAELAGVTRRFFQRTMARNGIRSSEVSAEHDDD
jgi:transcriptional regulator with PAS, ATPase and Fis domain